MSYYYDVIDVEGYTATNLIVDVFHTHQSQFLALDQ